jgi:hypothetical protein
MVLLADCPAARPRLAAAWGCGMSPPCENHDLIIFNPYIDREKPFYETVLTRFLGLALLNHPTIGEALAS